MRILAIFLLNTVIAVRFLHRYLDIPLENSRFVVTQLSTKTSPCLISKFNTTQGSILASIPLSLTLSSISDYPLSKYLSSLPPHIKTTVLVIYSYYTNSSLLKELATYESNPLIFWEPAQLKLLETSALQLSHSDIYNLGWESDYLKVKSLLHDIETVPQELFNETIWRKAHSYVLSNTFNIPLGEFSKENNNLFCSNDDDLSLECNVDLKHSPEKSSEFVNIYIPIFNLASLHYVPSAFRSTRTSYLQIRDRKISLIAQKDLLKGEEVYIELNSMNNYDLLMRKGIALEKNYLEEFYVVKSEDSCDDISCRWVLKSFEINQGLLSELTYEKTEISGLVAYRNKISSIKDSGKYPLRHLRRIKPHYSLKYTGSLNFGICQRLLLLNHMRMAEARILTYLITNLGLN